MAIVRKMPLDLGVLQSIKLEENDIVSYSPSKAPFCNICRYQLLTSRHLLTTSIKNDKKKSILIIELDLAFNNVKPKNWFLAAKRSSSRCPEIT